MKKRLLIVLALTFLLFSTAANAINTMTFSPSPVTMNIGEKWDLNIIFVGEIYGAPHGNGPAILWSLYYKFDYDPMVISVFNVNFGEWALNNWDPSNTSYTIENDKTIFLEIGGYIVLSEKKYSIKKSSRQLYLKPLDLGQVLLKKKAAVLQGRGVKVD